MVLAFCKHVCDNGQMDWTQIIRDLMAAGLTQIEIARRIGASQALVSALLNGKRRSPNWKLGDSLIKLHARTMRKAA